jgi:hypothetical protein
MQALAWPGAISTNGGFAALHASVAKPQRGAKAQPEGSCDSNGGWPGMEARGWRTRSARGTEFSRPKV